MSGTQLIEGVAYHLRDSTLALSEPLKQETISQIRKNTGILQKRIEEEIDDGDIYSLEGHESFITKSIEHMHHQTVRLLP